MITDTYHRRLQQEAQQVMRQRDMQALGLEFERALKSDLERCEQNSPRIKIGHTYSCTFHPLVVTANCM